MAGSRNQESGPVKRFKCYGIEASIWQHEKGYSVSIKKQYKDQDGNWKETNVFFQDDLPKLALVAGKAYEFIVLMD